MNTKTILKVESPKTQSVEAVKALLAWKGRASDPLPKFVEMGAGESRLVLVLSNKKDCFYVVTARDCSCPARSWHPGQPCKPSSAIKQPNHGAWHGHNGPVLDEVRPAAKVSSPLYVDTLGETTARDIAYHSIKADREMWPMVEA